MKRRILSIVVAETLLVSDVGDDYRLAGGSNDEC